MDIRSFLYRKKENRKKRLRYVFMWFMILVFFTCVFLLNKKQPVQQNDYFIGQKITFSWTLTADNNYPTNTHKVSNWMESFWLKESQINLNNFLNDNVLIEWFISEITAKYPILSISVLKIPEYKLSVVENRFFYTNDLISFDFSKDVDVFSKKTWWDIVVYYQWEPFLSVRTFICSNVTESQNCERIKMERISSSTETFDSVLWYTFYKNKENSWITFNDNNIGYIFTVDSDADLLNVSHLINIVDSNFLSTYKKDLILSWCSDETYQMTKISGLSKKIIDDNLIKVQISGTDQSKKKILCKLNIDIFNNREINNVSISEWE